uniref:Uncharacterized protein n=1 Tax=Oryza rufipogon TaxID=4529 RepID=A0A0E0Q5J3_ORYRU
MAAPSPERSPRRRGPTPRCSACESYPSTTTWRRPSPAGFDFSYSHFHGEGGDQAPLLTCLHIHLLQAFNRVRRVLSSVLSVSYAVRRTFFITLKKCPNSLSVNILTIYYWLNAWMVLFLIEYSNLMSLTFPIFFTFCSVRLDESSSLSNNIPQLDGSSDENQEVPQEDDGAMPTEKEPSVSFMSRTGKNSHATTDKTGRESFSRSDIIVGWEIQLGSLGFFAEGAGIGLLKRISRTPPNQMKHPPMNPVEESCQEFPGASSADDVIDDASESNWSHTHASGIHVDGRIILNLWRLMRAEIKLNNYSLEAVADEVLRKVPLVPTKILNRWFATGPGRGRYRCIEYVNN